jgi:GMP synthase (glutamine-hydrolysing)
MSSPRLLVIEGNTAASCAEQIAAGGTASGEGYAELLRKLAPGATVDICRPADGEVALPAGLALEAYDGAAITGSSLHVYNGGPAVERQIALVRAVLAAGVPVFGSCWGLQVLTVAAGGSVRNHLWPRDSPERRRPCAPDVCRQDRRIRRYDLPSRRGGEAGARNNGIGEQRAF